MIRMKRRKKAESVNADITTLLVDATTSELHFLVVAGGGCQILLPGSSTVSR
jgi:hypothetical protein